MRVFHTNQSDTSSTDDCVEGLRAGLQALRSATVGDDFERVEGEVHELFVAAERAFLGEVLADLDVNVPALWMDGKLHHRALRSAMTYTSAVGPVSVTRTLIANVARRRWCRSSVARG